MTRREFLTWLPLSAALASGSAGAAEQSRPRRAVHHAPQGAAKIDRAGISSRSFRNSFEATRDPARPTSAGRLALLDFPELVADRYEVHNLEFEAPHFASLEPAYLLELKSALLRARSRLVNISASGEPQRGGGLSDPSPAGRDAALVACKKWIDIVRQLGARSVSCDPGTLDPGNLSVTLDSYRQLVAYGRTKGIAVLIENHGAAGFSDAEALVSVVHSIGGPLIGVLPDFGSFADDATRMRVLPMLFGYARNICHATGLALDGAGNETAFNFQQCVQVAQKGGFKGVYSIEYDGSGDPYQGVQAVLNELLRCL
jgi:Xylose isomerase-like TIM barrel